MNFIKLPKLKQPQREVLMLVKDSWVKLAISSVCSAIVAAMIAATAYLVKPAVEKLFEQKDSQMLVLIPIASIRGSANS